MKTIVTLALALAPMIASAQAAPIDLKKVAADLAKIQQFIPAGTVLAGTYIRDFSGDKIAYKALTGDDLLTGIASSYALVDMNKDGKIDLALVAESAPTVDKDGSATAGTRSLLVFLNDGKTEKLLARGDKAIYGADEGGASGDPFQGIYVRKNGSFSTTMWGGSADKWSYTNIYQVRGGDVKVIGHQDMMSGYEMKYQTVVVRTTDTNLITGDQISTVTKIESDASKTSKKKVAVKPLVSLKNATADME